MQSLTDLLWAGAGSASGTIIEDGSESYDLAGFRALAEKAARTLSGMGVGAGDRVLFAAPNSARLAAAIFGAMRIGAIPCPLHPENGRGRLKYFCDVTGAVASVADAPCHEKFHTGTRLRACYRIDTLACKGRAKRRSAKFEEPTEGLALLLHTSGSTGVPLGVRIGHAQALFSVRSIAATLGISQTDAIYCGLPFSFDYGLYQLFMALLTGARLVIRQDFHLPMAIPRDLKETRATVFPAVPSLIAAVLKSNLLERVSLPDLRLVTSTGDVLPHHHFTRLRRALPGAEVVRMYGLTECKRVSIMPVGEGGERPGSVGKPLEGTRVWLESHRGVVAEPGEVGELVVAGPHVMDGYWGDAEATRRRFPALEGGGSALSTGDLFRIDEEGYLYFVARKGKMIKTSANAVSPLEIENYLAGLESVSEAAVCAVPDEDRGALVCAALAVSRNSTLDAETVRSRCAEDLAPYCVPTHVKFFPSRLPKTENGKINRKVIKSHFAKA